MSMGQTVYKNSMSTRISIVLTLLSGLLFVGCFPRLDCGALAWVAFVPFLCTFPHRNVSRAIAHGFLFGIVAYGGILYWLAIFATHAIGRPLGVVAWLIGAIAQTTATVGFSIILQYVTARGSRISTLFAIPSVWIIFEWIRQLGMLGTGWGDIGYSQHNALDILQITRLGGVWLLGYVIVFVNAAIVSVLRSRRMYPWLISAVCVVAFGCVYGRFILTHDTSNPSFIASALQANVNQNVTWNGMRPRDPRYVSRVMTNLVSQMQQTALVHSSMSVTAETSFPGYLRFDPKLLKVVSRAAMQTHQAILIGGYDYDPETRKSLNALFLVNADGVLSGEYEKRQLVPFGEFIPLRTFLPFLEALHLDTISDLDRGGNVQPLMDAGGTAGKIGVALCYESSYPALTREQIVRGASVLVVATDDTWFGHTAAAAQHAAIAAIRSSESDRYLVRTAATGISEIIDNHGRVLVSTGLFERKAISAKIESRSDLTLYERFGDWIVVVCGVSLAVILWTAARAKPRS